MQAFYTREDKTGWESRMEPPEANLLAAVFDELADALEQEEKRDVLEMMGVDLEQSSPLRPQIPLMFERALGLYPDTQQYLQHDTQTDSSPTQTPPTAANESSSSRATQRKSGSASRLPRNPSPPSSAPTGLSDEQRLADLDFIPLGRRPAPANPYVGAILRPMSQDAEEAAELRALTTPDLARRKAAGLRRVASCLRWAADQFSPVLVKPETAGTWLSAINDTRLALGWALGIEDDSRSEEVELISQADPQLEVYADYEVAFSRVYVVLSWWQGSLLQAMEGQR